MRSTIVAVLLATTALAVSAKLPPLGDEAKSKAAEAAAKGSWADKIGLYQLCQSMDRVADGYRKGAKSAGKEAPSAVAVASCVDPGPYAAQQITPAASKPLEAAGAHSPPGMAVSPPSTNATAAQIAGGVKK